MFPKPIIIACGAKYLETQTGSDGVERAYDTVTRTFEPLDETLEACETAGRFGSSTMFAMQRVTTNVNAAEGPGSRRTVMRLCAAALEDKLDATSMEPVAINLLEQSKLAVSVVPNIYRVVKRSPKKGIGSWTIDRFRGPDFYILVMVLGYVSGLSINTGSGPSNLAEYEGYWAWCLTQMNLNLSKFESLLCM